MQTEKVKVRFIKCVGKNEKVVKLISQHHSIIPRVGETVVLGTNYKVKYVMWDFEINPVEVVIELEEMK